MLNHEKCLEVDHGRVTGKRCVDIQLLPFFSGAGGVHPFPGFFDGSVDTSGVQGGGAVGLLERRMKQETLRRRTSDKDSM
jgi:hypothetical protein